MVETRIRHFKLLLSVVLCLSVVTVGCSPREESKENGDNSTALEKGAEGEGSDAGASDADFDYENCELQQQLECDLFDEALALSSSIEGFRTSLAEREYIPTLAAYVDGKRGTSLPHVEIYESVESIGISVEAFEDSLNSSDYEDKAELQPELSKIESTAERISNVIQPVAEGNGVSDPVTNRGLKCAIMQSGSDALAVETLIKDQTPSSFDGNVSNFCNVSFDAEEWDRNPDFGVFDAQTFKALEAILIEGQTQLAEAKQAIGETLRPPVNDTQDADELVVDSPNSSERRAWIGTVMPALLGLVIGGGLVAAFLPRLLTGKRQNYPNAERKSIQPSPEANSEIPISNNSNRSQVSDTVAHNNPAAEPSFMTEKEVRQIVNQQIGAYKSQLPQAQFQSLSSESVADDELSRKIKLEVTSAPTLALIAAKLAERTGTAPVQIPPQTYNDTSIHPAHAPSAYQHSAQYSSPQQVKNPPEPKNHTSSAMTSPVPVVDEYNAGQFSRRDAEDIVAITTDAQEAIRLGQTAAPILSTDRERGSYWVVNKDSTFYLLPSTKARFNANSIQPLSSLYDYPESPNLEKPIRLHRPATVVSAGNGKWQLTNRGKLSFG